MAMYVAKNGVEFEFVVNSKHDPRFAFLKAGHVHHHYYTFKKNMFLKVRTKSVNFLLRVYPFPAKACRGVGGVVMFVMQLRKQTNVYFCSSICIPLFFNTCISLFFKLYISLFFNMYLFVLQEAELKKRLEAKQLERERVKREEEAVAAANRSISFSIKGKGRDLETTSTLKRPQAPLFDYDSSGGEGEGEWMLFFCL
jgi:hypothetical protein